MARHCSRNYPPVKRVGLPYTHFGKLNPVFMPLPSRSNAEKRRKSPPVAKVGLAPEVLSAELVARVYRRRWQIECFFRWVKCLLGCRHWLAESPSGVSHQLYLALIAAVLFQRALGQRPNQRIFELIRLYQMGVATLDELMEGVPREIDRVAAKRKKS